VRSPTGYLKENSRIKQDTIMGIVFSGMFGWGSSLYTKIETDVHSTTSCSATCSACCPLDFGRAARIAVFVTAAHRAEVARSAAARLSIRSSQGDRAAVRLYHYGLLALLS
jgi:manganese/iron transport system permease protein